MTAPPVIADHTLLRPIGRGAYGEVWLGRNIMAVLRAIMVIRREQFDSDRPYEREFAGIQRYEPVSRTSGELGQRIRALDAVRRAGAISNSASVRGVAVAALGLPDLQLERELPLAADAGNG
jgi:hypothetical protein